MHYKITLTYNGSDFCGWQRQNDAPSVQQKLESGLSTLLRRDITVTGAGRTDTGVSAIGYVADFETVAAIDDLEEFTRKLNAILPDSICIHSVEDCIDGFNSRFDAVRREYTYYIHRSKDPFVENYSYRYAYPELDFDAMNKAAELILGKHDFSCFEKTGSDNRTSICTVSEAHWYPYTPTVCAHGDKEGSYWMFRISADRFLRNMVRAIVGTLLEVGRGKRTPESISTLIDSKNRCNAGESVPGHALFLTGIKYK